MANVFDKDLYNKLRDMIEAAERESQPKAERERGQVVYSFEYSTDAADFVRRVKKEPHAFVTEPS